MNEQPPEVYQFSVKIEYTAKGARPTVHVFENNILDVPTTAVELLKATIKKLKQHDIPVAPIEIKEK